MSFNELPLMERLLKCPVCLNFYGEPRCLPCGHSICSSCLQEAIKEKERSALRILICQVCACGNPIPASGVEGYRLNVALQEICGYLIEPINAEVFHEETDLKTEVIFCRNHRTKRLDRVCMTCRHLMCASCEVDRTKHSEHSVILLENKNRMLEACHQIEKYCADDIVAHKRQLDLQKRALDNLHELVNATHEEFDLLEDKVVNAIRQTFRRRKEMLLARFLDKQTSLMVKCELRKASIEATKSLVSKMKSERPKLSVLYRTFSSLNSVFFPRPGTENNDEDQKVSYFSELEQELKLVVTKCIDSLENISFSLKRTKQRAICPESSVNREKPESSTGFNRKPSKKANPGLEKPAVPNKFKRITSAISYLDHEQAEISTEFQEKISTKCTSEDKEVDIQTELEERVSPKVPERKDKSADGLPLIEEESFDLENSPFASHYSTTGSRTDDKMFSSRVVGNITANECFAYDSNDETKEYNCEHPEMYEDSEENTHHPAKDSQTSKTECADNNVNLDTKKQIFKDNSGRNHNMFSFTNTRTSQDLAANDGSQLNESCTDLSCMTMPGAIDDDISFPHTSSSSKGECIKKVDEDLNIRSSSYVDECISITSSESCCSTAEEKPSQGVSMPLGPASEVVPKYEIKVIRTFGSKGRNPGQFNQPEGLAVGSNGNVYVVDSLNNRVQVFNSSLEFLFLFGKLRPGLLKKPFDVAVHVSDVTSNHDDVRDDITCNAVIVADKYNNKLQFFREDGEFLETFGKKGRKRSAQFEGPSCVALNSKGHVVITDTLNHRIQIIKTNSNEDNEIFGNTGEGYLNFCNPVGVAIGRDDNIIVADYGNDRMQILSRAGQTLKVFGQGELSRPTHVAVSPLGNIFVSDSGNNRIQIFDSNGNVLQRFGSMGKEPGRFQQPGGITWLFNGQLVVSDVDNCRLQIFDCPF